MNITERIKRDVEYSGTKHAIARYAIMKKDLELAIKFLEKDNADITSGLHDIYIVMGDIIEEISDKEQYKDMKETEEKKQEISSNVRAAILLLNNAIMSAHENGIIVELSNDVWDTNFGCVNTYKVDIYEKIKY